DPSPVSLGAVSLGAVSWAPFPWAPFSQAAGSLVAFLRPAAVVGKPPAVPWWIPCEPPIPLRPSPARSTALRSCLCAWERPRASAKLSGRLDERPASGSLGLLPSGPDPVGEGYVHRQPPELIMERRAANYNRAAPERSVRRQNRSASAHHAEQACWA